jgi:hypothetical protein
MVWATLGAEQNAAINELIHGQQSDRIVAILGGALLDDSLRQALELRLRAKDGNTDMNEKLFRAGGPLGNLQPKIDLGYQLYLLDKSYRNSMCGLAEIRNLFAHNLSMTFSDSGEKMKNASAKLTLHDGKEFFPSPVRWHENRHPIGQVNSLKDKFLVNLKFCLLWLFMDSVKHHANCNAPTDFSDEELPPA